jgi:hypothetical protein
VQRYNEGDELPDENEAYDMGFQAAMDGLTDADNPFPISTDQHLSWNDGWLNFHDQQDEQSADRLRQLAASFPAVVGGQVEALLALSMASIGERIDVPVEDWPGRCFEIASKIVDSFDWQDAAAVYGHYRGPISRECALFYGKPVVHHGWILLKTGVVVDPTRWVFEAREPYIAVFRPWEREHAEVFASIEYDEGGEVFNEKLRGPRPEYNPQSQCVSISAGGGDAATVRAVMGRLLGALVSREVLSVDELRWLAKTPYSKLGDGAAVLYPWLVTAGLRPLIPIDYLRRAERNGIAMERNG